MTSMLHDLLGRVDRLIAVGVMDEEAGGNVAAAAAGAAWYGSRLHFEEIGLLSPNDDGIGLCTFWDSSSPATPVSASAANGS